jgi:hypothetical protein
MSVTRRRFLASLGTAATLRLRSAPGLSSKPRLPRKDCFFGIHLDLHPAKNDTVLGRDVTESMIESFLASVKPDYVQYDCKGHAGYMGYPSKVGTPSPGIVRDSLEIWRRVTERHGVGLYIHFSGVWDSLAIEQHPDWACVRADGTPDPNATSTFGPYADQLMIPQLKEASERYRLDGAWIDGECWAVKPDYSPAAVAAFKESTGIAVPPKSASDPGWLEWLELHREQFRRHVRHYREELRKSRPSFQIASNWLYTTFVPEKPEIPVDFISGDYLGNASVSTARLEARYIAQTGKPWDLMAWGFQQRSGQAGRYTHKPAIQLQQEASVVLAQSGGFQVYYQPTRAGRLDQRLIDTMAKVARFCRERQAFCRRTETVPQIGVVFSARSLYRTAGRMFGSWGGHTAPARGFVDALVDSGYAVDVLPEWALEHVAERYPLVVVPDWPDTGEMVRDIVAARVRAGGNALVAGAANTALFGETLGVRRNGEPSETPAYVAGAEVWANVQGLWQAVDPDGAEVIETRFPTFDSSRDGLCAATLNQAGSGRIAAVHGPAGALYASTHAAALRQFLQRIVQRIFTPAAAIEGPPVLELVLRRKEGRLLVHLLNLAQMQVGADYVAGDFVPPVGPVRVSIKLSRPPARATLEPGARPIRGRYAAGVWSVSVPRIAVHEILVLEESRP